MDFNLRREDAVFLFIDIQDSLSKVIDREERLKKNAGILADTAEIMQIPSVFTTQYKKGLGDFNEEIRNKVKDAEDFDKKSFSCLLDDEIAAFFDEKKPKQVIVSGMEAHICVLMTVRDLIARGIDVYVASDAIGSRDPESALYAAEEMRQMGAAVRPTETILFDLNSVSGTDEFKAVQKLIK
ncbi:Isochorismatase family [Aedoeadaptatus ivorii]|uniref:Isochorismatase family n=1 Tax=Aedoeadaptatus ivorii TaxID=54006 RepID=A0A448V1V7_9FIRM|nr:isochorismatase family protein [Peptoniphilus ivorii]MDQ0508977.1 nicotinamidase-related amidase [Peptoniphilus ivorii]VEJ35803.1 Isochorismatase family [Peptoniphilus ivorii]